MQRTAVGVGVAGRTRRAVAVALSAVALGGCGGGPTAGVVDQPSALGSLLTIDQLVSPDFTVDVAAHDLTVAAVAAGGDGVAMLTAAGFRAAAAEDFFRDVGTLADVNGPVQVADTVEFFGGAAGAASVYAADIARRGAQSGATALSTGALGDQAHATQRTADAHGVTAVEITVEWRVANVVNLLTVRGRWGGTRLSDALLLAHLQTSNELLLTTPRPGAPAAP